MSADLGAAAATLMIEFLKQRRGRGEALDSADFREWLQTVAFPQLMESSTAIATSLVSLKAHGKQRFDRIESLLEDLMAAVQGPTAAQRWAKLPELERRILEALLDVARREIGGASIDGSALVTQLGVDAKAARAAAHYLQDQGLALAREFAGGWFVRGTSAGILLAWAALDTEAHAAALAALPTAVPDSSATMRLHTFAERLNVPVGVAYYLAHELASQRHLAIDDGSPVEYSTVYRASESLRRGHVLL